MTEIKTNDRFDKLTNLDISTRHRGGEFWLMRCDFLGAFAYWVVAQSPYDTPDITPALEAFGAYIAGIIEDDIPKKFTYDEVSALITGEVFEAIPEIEKLNHRKNGREGVGFSSRYSKPHPDDDFIALGALARNVFYMIIREQVTQS